MNRKKGRPPANLITPAPRPFPKSLYLSLLGIFLSWALPGFVVGSAIFGDEFEGSHDQEITEILEEGTRVSAAISSPTKTGETVTAEFVYRRIQRSASITARPSEVKRAFRSTAKPIIRVIVIEDTSTGRSLRAFSQAWLEHNHAYPLAGIPFGAIFLWVTSLCAGLIAVALQFYHIKNLEGVWGELLGEPTILEHKYRVKVSFHTYGRQVQVLASWSVDFEPTFDETSRYIFGIVLNNFKPLSRSKILSMSAKTRPCFKTPPNLPK